MLARGVVGVFFQPPSSTHAPIARPLPIATPTHAYNVMHQCVCVSDTPTIACSGTLLRAPLPHTSDGLTLGLEEPEPMAYRGVQTEPVPRAEHSPSSVLTPAPLPKLG
jgi:hypothetical protein